MVENPSKDERVTDAWISSNIDWYAQARPDSQGGSIRRALLELQANRRGEFICSRCYLRKDAEVINVDF